MAKSVTIDADRKALYEPHLAAIADLQKLDLGKLLAADPFTAEVDNVLLKSAAVHAHGNVIAIGKNGGKIVGYDKQNHPIYMNESIAPGAVKVDHTGTAGTMEALAHVAGPVVEFAKIFAHLGDVHADIRPNPSQPNIYNLDISGPNGKAVADAVAKAIAHKVQGVLVSTRTLPLPGGHGVRIALKCDVAPSGLYAVVGAKVQSVKQLVDAPVGAVIATSNHVYTKGVDDKWTFGSQTGGFKIASDNFADMIVDGLAKWQDVLGVNAVAPPAPAAPEKGAVVAPDQIASAPVGAKIKSKTGLTTYVKVTNGNWKYDGSALNSEANMVEMAAQGVLVWGVVPGGYLPPEPDEPIASSVAKPVVGEKAVSVAQLDEAPVGAKLQGIYYTFTKANISKKWISGSGSILSASDVLTLGADDNGKPGGAPTWLAGPGVSDGGPVVGQTVSSVDQLDAAPVGSQFKFETGTQSIWTKTTFGNWSALGVDSKAGKDAANFAGYLHDLAWVNVTGGPQFIEMTDPKAVAEPDFESLVGKALPNDFDVGKLPIGSQVALTSKKGALAFKYTKTGENVWDSENGNQTTGQYLKSSTYDGKVMLVGLEPQTNVPPPIVIADSVDSADQLGAAPVGSQVKSKMTGKTYEKDSDNNWNNIVKTDNPTVDDSFYGNDAYKPSHYLEWVKVGSGAAAAAPASVEPAPATTNAVTDIAQLMESPIGSKISLAVKGKPLPMVYTQTAQNIWKKVDGTGLHLNPHAILSYVHEGGKAYFMVPEPAAPVGPIEVGTVLSTMEHIKACPVGTRIQEVGGNAMSWIKVAPGKWGVADDKHSMQNPFEDDTFQHALDDGDVLKVIALPGSVAAHTPQSVPVGTKFSFVNQNGSKRVFEKVSDDVWKLHSTSGGHMTDIPFQNWEMEAKVTTFPEGKWTLPGEADAFPYKVGEKLVGNPHDAPVGIAILSGDSGSTLHKDAPNAWKIQYPSGGFAPFTMTDAEVMQTKNWTITAVPTELAASVAGADSASSVKVGDIVHATKDVLSKLPLGTQGTTSGSSFQKTGVSQWTVLTSKYGGVGDIWDDGGFASGVKMTVTSLPAEAKAAPVGLVSQAQTTFQAPIGAEFVYTPPSGVLRRFRKMGPSAWNAVTTENGVESLSGMDWSDSEIQDKVEKFSSGMWFNPTDVAPAAPAQPYPIGEKVTSQAQLDAAPVGAKFEYLENGTPGKTIYTKQADGKWLGDKGGAKWPISSQNIANLISDEDVGMTFIASSEVVAPEAPAPAPATPATPKAKSSWALGSAKAAAPGFWKADNGGMASGIFTALGASGEPFPIVKELGSIESVIDAEQNATALVGSILADAGTATTWGAGGQKSLVPMITGSNVEVTTAQGTVGPQGVVKSVSDVKAITAPKLNQTQATQLLAAMVTHWALGCKAATPGGSNPGVVQDAASGDICVAWNGEVGGNLSGTPNLSDMASANTAYADLLEGIKQGKVKVKLDGKVMNTVLARLNTLKNNPFLIQNTESADAVVTIAARGKQAGDQLAKLFAQNAAAPTPSKVKSDKVPDGYKLVENPEALTTKVNLSASADKAFMGATVTVETSNGTIKGEVIGRSRMDSDVYKIKDATTGHIQNVQKYQLVDADIKGNVQRRSGNPFYWHLPEKALVLDAPASVKAKLQAGLDITIAHSSSPRKLMAVLESKGITSLLVGGTVRDAIAGVDVKDVDVVTSASYANSLQVLSGLGYTHKGMSAQNTVKVGGHATGDDGFDVASMRGTHFNAPMYGDTSKKYGSMADESISIATDVVNRDFACNAIYYDVENDKMIDATGRSIADSQSQTLHPPIDDHEAWLNANGPRNFARAFKFIGRGYKVSPELTKLMGDRFLEQMARPEAMKQAGNALYGAQEKYLGKPAAKKKCSDAMTAWASANFSGPTLAKMKDVIAMF